MAWSDAPLGIVPPFLREPARPIDPGGRRRAPAAAPSPACYPTDAAERDSVRDEERAAAPARPAVNRLYALADAETLRIRRKASDALGLAQSCEHAACRRAKACAGVGGAICLMEVRDFIVSALRHAEGKADE